MAATWKFDTIPLNKRLIGAKVGDKVTFTVGNAPSGTAHCVEVSGGLQTGIRVVFRVFCYDVQVATLTAFQASADAVIELSLKE